MRSTLLTAVVIALVVSAHASHADTDIAATALFEQGIADLSAGNTAQACKELAASLAKVPDSGTEGALAECDTKLGKLASAWNLWKELADTAPTPELRSDAATNAKQLAPRLPRFIVRLQGGVVPGLGHAGLTLLRW